MALTKARFCWDNPEEGPTFEGWHDPAARWNGWATPAFERSEADRIMAYNQGVLKADATSEIENISFDEAGDCYVLYHPVYAKDEGTQYQPEKVRGTDADCGEGLLLKRRHLYAIGSWAWTWYEVDEHEGEVDPPELGVTSLLLARAPAAVKERPKRLKEVRVRDNIVINDQTFQVAGIHGGTISRAGRTGSAGEEIPGFEDEDYTLHVRRRWYR